MVIKLNSEQLDDYEFMTPAQAAEARRMKAELPLWQEMELLPRSDAASLDATDAVDTGLDGLESTIDAHNGQSSINASTNVSSKFYPDNDGRPSWADYVAQIELHRQLNKTEGMESEA